MSVKSSTELMLYVVLTMPTLNKAYLFIYYLLLLQHGPKVKVTAPPIKNRKFRTLGVLPFDIWFSR
jgi:hypothetical protein